MKSMRFVWILVLATFLMGGAVFGQDILVPDPALIDKAPISTDRPSFTTGPVLVDPGIWQLELGYTYREGVGDSGEDIGTFPEILVRYGLNEKWELRAGWDGYSFLDEVGDDIAGNTLLGFKYRIANQTGFKPAMALITTVSLPTGSGGGEVDPQILLGWDYALDEQTILAGNLGVGIPTDEITDDRFAQGVFSLMCSRTITDSTSGFAEYYTNFPAMDEQDAEHVLQAGIMYLLNPNAQFDVHVGLGLNNQADDWFVGVGFSHRF